MNYDQFTIKTQEAIQDAASLAQKNDHGEIGLEHLLSALLNQQDGIVVPIVEHIGVGCASLKNQVENLLSQYPKVTGNAQVRFSSETEKTIAKAENEMSKLKDKFLSCEHILLSMTKSDGRVGELLCKNGITYESVMESLKSVRVNHPVVSQDPESNIFSL